MVRILVLEQEPCEANLIAKTLQATSSVQFEITCVDRLQSPMLILGKRDYHVVLLTVPISGSQSLETLARVLTADPDIPVLVITEREDESLAVRAVRMGAQDCMASSQLDTRILVRRIRLAVERNRILTSLKRARQQEHHRATHDALTGLPGRDLFFDRLSLAMAFADRYREEVGLLFLDLDEFKRINDTYGHTVGDQLLKAVAKRLSRCIRDTDTVARLGGDEFTFILERVPDHSHIIKVTDKILHTLSKPFLLGGHVIPVTASIGVAVYPHDGKTVRNLLESADRAMYRSKSRGVSQH